MDFDGVNDYQNGALINTVSLSGLTLTASTAPIRLMADTMSLSGFAKGQMDEVHIWNRALSQSEIQAGMNCELGSTPTGLVARYTFNQGLALANNSTVTTLTDGSSNSNNGALTNFALTGSSSNWVAPGAVGQACSAATGASARQPTDAPVNQVEQNVHLFLPIVAR